MMRLLLALAVIVIGPSLALADDPWADRDEPPARKDPRKVDPWADRDDQPVRKGEAAATGDIVVVGAYMDRRMDVIRQELTYDTVFVVLYKGNRAHVGMSVLTGNPSSTGWRKWRKAGSEYEVQIGSAWKRLTEFKPATGARLSRGYARSQTAIKDARNIDVQAWSTIAFRSDGTFTLGGGASASGHNVHVGGASEKRGRYQIQGYTLTLRFDDGTTQVRSIVVNPSGNNRVIYLDGHAYTS